MPAFTDSNERQGCSSSRRNHTNDDIYGDRCYTRSSRRTYWLLSTKTWSNRLRKAYESDAGNLRMHNLADTRIYAKAAGSEKAMMSATNF